MKRVIRILLVVLALIGFVCLVSYGCSTIIHYNLNDYSCEEIELSIINGDCLKSSKIKLLGGVTCFNPKEKFIYYVLFCKEDKNEVIRLK